MAAGGISGTGCFVVVVKASSPAGRLIICCPGGVDDAMDAGVLR
jgi:hypothetical protein